jgi:hypothetical protein
MPKPPGERLIPLHQYNTLYSLWQQALAENEIYKRFLWTLYEVRAAGYSPEDFKAAFEAAGIEFRRLMRPVRAMRKARPKHL